MIFSFFVGISSIFRFLEELMLIFSVTLFQEEHKAVRLDRMKNRDLDVVKLKAKRELLLSKLCREPEVFLVPERKSKLK